MTIAGSGGSVELVANQQSLSVSAEQLAPAGAGPATIEVRQVGDWSVSRPAQLTITL